MSKLLVWTYGRGCFGRSAVCVLVVVFCSLSCASPGTALPLSCSGWLSAAVLTCSWGLVYKEQERRCSQCQWAAFGSVLSAYVLLARAELVKYQNGVAGYILFRGTVFNVNFSSSSSFLLQWLLVWFLFLTSGWASLFVFQKLSTVLF